MVRDSAEVRGRAKVRPYRVGQLIDTSSADEVRAAIASLTEAWGGIYTPILDVNQPFENIELQARIFDVDALHLEAEGGDLVEKFRRSGWLWGGRGRFGPFASEEGSGRGSSRRARSRWTIRRCCCLDGIRPTRSICSTRRCSVLPQSRSTGRNRRRRRVGAGRVDAGRA